MLIKIGESIRMFGFKDGISFVFEWYIASTIRNWYREHILRKDHCYYHGLNCKEHFLNCKYKHFKKFPKRPEIEIWDWCTFCGEASASRSIRNPNTLYKDSKDGLWWKVCADCDEMIEAQDQLGMAISFGNVAMKHGFADEAEPQIREQINKSKSKIQEIEKRTGKPSVTIQFTKTESGYESRKL